MTIQSKILAIGSLTIFSLFAGCAKAPEQKFTAAKHAFEQAVSVDAEKFAKNEFASAREAFDNANVVLKNENKKLVLFRNYDNAVKLFEKAALLAQKATESAKIQQEQIRIEQEKAQLEIEKQKSMKTTKKKTIPKK